MRRTKGTLTLQEFQKLHGIKRIDFSKVQRTDLEKQYGSDELICPYCEAKIQYEGEEIDDILGGESYQCPWCEKWFYAEGEVSINTTCTPIEDAVLEPWRKRNIEGMYKHMDKCAEHELLFEESRYGNVEWETYYEYARPLFENAKGEKQ